MNPYTIAEETLGQSSMQRNLPGMVSKTPPGPNMFDGGAESKPGVNSQLASNERLRMQEMSRNIESAGPQANVGAARGVGSRLLMLLMLKAKLKPLQLTACLKCSTQTSLATL